MTDSTSSMGKWAGGDASERRALSRLKALPRVRHGVALPPPLVPGGKDEYHAACAKAGFPGHLAPEIKNAPVVDVVIGPYRSVQHSVNPDRCAQYIHKPDLQPPGAVGVHGGPIDQPIIVKAGGVPYVHDGNHRIAAAVLRGERTFKARYVDLDTLKPTS